MIVLDEGHQEAIREAISIGVGAAAASLSEMLGEGVLLSVPHLTILPRREAVGLMCERFGTSGRAVRQRFQAELSGHRVGGHGFLVMGDQDSRQLTDRLVGSTGEAMEQDVLAEVGNILLNACFGGLANFLETELACEIPEVFFDQFCRAMLDAVRNPSSPTLRRLPEDQQPPCLNCTIHVQAASGQVSGDLIFFLDLVALVHLRGELDLVIARYRPGSKAATTACLPTYGRGGL